MMILIVLVMSGEPSIPTDLAGMLNEAAEHHGIDRRLLVAVARRESGFRRNAVSPAGARGVMQLMPATARWLGVRDPFDPRENIFAAARYLKKLQKMFNGDLDLMLAAYNAGPTTVRRHGGVPAYGETQSYVRAIRDELAREQR